MSDSHKTLAKYQILEQLGKGGFATVFRARDPDLERDVALKVLDPMLMRDPVWVQRFRREARAIARFKHPHIVRIHEIGQSEGSLYIAMELAEGGNLDGRIEQEEAASWAEVVQLVGEIAEALDYAHQQGVLHRDLKPANVLLEPGIGAVLTDFGFVRMLADNSMSVSMSGGVIGTPAYIAPEVWKGEQATAQTDIYALGCILYELVTGEQRFQGPTPPAVMMAHFQPQAMPETWPQDAPPGLSKVLEMALAREPAERYQTAGDLAAALADLSIDALAEPYAELEAAIESEDWRRALALADEIRAQEDDYRDVDALDQQALAGMEQAAREQQAEQWRKMAQEALASDNFEGVELAVAQWLQLLPGDEEAVGVLQEMETQRRGQADVEERRDEESSEQEQGAEVRVLQDKEMGERALIAGISKRQAQETESQITQDGQEIILQTGIYSWDNIREIRRFNTSHSFLGNLFQIYDPILSFDISPAGNDIIAAGPHGHIWFFPLEDELNESWRNYSAHDDSILGICFSPDGMGYASGSKDHSIKIWELDEQLLHHIETDEICTCLAYSPDGGILLAGYGSGAIEAWSTTNGTSMAVFEGHKENINTVSFSPSGELFASGSSDESIRIWRVNNGKTVRILEGHTGEVMSIGFSPDGKYVASGSADDTVRLWNILTGESILILEGHTSVVDDIDFSSSGTYLVSGSWDRTVRIWHLPTGVLFRTLEGHNSDVTGVAFYSDSKFIVSSSYDGTIRLWGAS